MAMNAAGRERSTSSKNFFSDTRENQTMSSHGNFHWNELMSRDVERAKQFSRDTIGWSYQSMPMADGRTYFGRIAILREPGGAGIGGITPAS